jgi:UDP-N-acetylmuramoyl-L-alanyl-D-glutamate--2,6-diaminopimelate ligase
MKLRDQVRNGRNVRSDSREVREGDIFVAVPGITSHGRAYISDAVQRGATAVVSEEHCLELPAGVEQIVVENVRDALGVLAGAACGTERPTFQLVAVTGTNGKTSVTYLLEHMLTRAGKRVGVVGTVGCRWPGGEEQSSMTTPDCLSLHRLLGTMARDGVDCVLMEASSHALDQDRLAGLDPDVAVFTNLTQDHLDYHRTFESYYQAKAKLFFGRRGRRPVPVVNMGDAYGSRLLADLGTGIGYTLPPCSGTDPGVRELCPETVRLYRDGIGLTIGFEGASITFRSPMVGRHNALNLLAALGGALALGVDPARLPDMSACPGAPGRLERVPNTRGLHLFVDYAHTPDALENVSRTLSELDFERLFVVFGCGGDRDRTKRPLMGQAVARYADRIFMTSDNPRTENPEEIMDDIEPGFPVGVNVVREADRRNAIRLALDAMQAGDALLVAGKGHEAYQIVGTKRISFHDGQVIRELLECR